MSFFLMDGIVCCCERCKREEIVELDMWRDVQIGDYGVREQVRRNEERGTKNKYYSDAKYVCSECLGDEAHDESTKEKMKLFYAIDRVNDDICPIHRYYNEIAKGKLFALIDTWFKNYSFKVDKPEIVAQLAKDKHISDPNRLKRLTKAIFYGTKLGKDYEERIIAEINAEAVVEPIRNEYLEKCEPHRVKQREMFAKIDDAPFTLWREICGTVSSSKQDGTAIPLKFYLPEEITPFCYVRISKPRISVKEICAEGFKKAGGVGGLREILAKEVLETAGL